MLTVKAWARQNRLVPADRSGDAAKLTLAIAGFLDACRSANTRAAYRIDLAHFEAWCATHEPVNLLTVDASELARYRTACELEGAGPATVARRLSAVSSFNSFAADRGLTPALEPAAAIERPTLNAESTAELLSDADAHALLEAADRAGKREAVLIRLLMLDGLKVGEATSADVDDVRGRPPHTELHVRGRSLAIVPLHPDTATAVRSYVGRRRDGPLLLSERRGQPAARLTRFGVDYLVKQTARAAGLDRNISGNALRRRFVMAADADGTDIGVIQRRAGHATPRTTRRYLSQVDVPAQPDGGS